MTEKEAPEISNDFELIDREDEEQILAELRGCPADKFIYENKRGEWDLTYAGTKWVVRKMAEEGEAIRIDGHPKVERCPIDPEYITVTVLGKRVKVDREAKAETLLDTNIGAARGWIKMPVKGSQPISDPFFYNKTVSKACRNLQLSLIPTDFKRRMVEQLRKGGGSGATQRPSQGQQHSPAGQGAQGPSQGAAQKPQNQQQSAPPAGGTQKPQNQSQQKPAGAQGQQSQQKQTQQKPSNPNDATIEAVQQHFRAVFIQFAGTEDKPTLQKTLKALTGKTAVTDLERGVMVELGPILRRKIKGEVKWTGTSLHEMSTGEQLWPKVEAQAEPPADAVPETAAPDEIPMF